MYLHGLWSMPACRTVVYACMQDCGLCLHVGLWSMPACRTVVYACM